MKTYLVSAVCLCFGQALAESPSPTPPKNAPQPGLLHHGEFGRVSCPQPLTAKKPADIVPQSASNAQRVIHARGVGEVLIAHPVPESIDQLEGVPYDAHFNRATSRLEHHDAMAQGHFNMAGYPTIRLKNLDLMMTLALDKRILSLSAGPQLRTPKGTGVGSTLMELRKAHGGFSMRRVPEPYRCSVTVEGLPFVWFMYQDCEKACQGSRALKVHVGGARFDDVTQSWLTPRLQPLPRNYTLPDGL